MADEARSPEPRDPAASTLERETLQAQVLERLREQFLTGEMVPGRKLTLRRVASSMGTGLMPVRDALQHLESIGVLEAQPNRTLAVPSFSPSELRDIVEIRMMLEGMAVERVALRARRADLRAFEEALSALEMARQRGGGAGYRRAHWAFHLSIVEASGIDTLVRLVKALWLQIGPNVKLGGADPDSIQEANALHRAIFSAIAAGDPEGARRALAADIFYGIDRQRGERTASTFGGTPPVAPERPIASHGRRRSAQDRG